MKFTIAKADFAELVTKGCSAAPKNAFIPILEHARIIAADGSLSISTTDLIVQAEINGSTANIDIEGAITVDASKLRAVVDRMPAGSTINVRLTDDAKEMIVSAGRSRARLPTLPVSDFPSLDSVSEDGAIRFRLSYADMEQLFTRPALAAPRADAQASLCSLFLHIRDWQGRPSLCSCGMDRKHIIVTAIAAPRGSERLPEHIPELRGLILPLEATRLALQLFKNADDVKVTASFNRVIFESESARLATKLVEGKYLDYRILFEAEGVGTILLDRAQAVATTTLVETFAPLDNNNKIECGAADNGGLIMAATAGTSGGSGRAVVDAEIEGDIGVLGLKSTHIKTVLGAFKGEHITIRVPEHPKPLCIHSSTEPEIIAAFSRMETSGRLVVGERVDEAI